MTWDGIEDPEGRLRKGMRVCWKHGPGGPFMRVLGLCAPSGLYRRPVVPGEEGAFLAVEGRMACKADHSQAEYEPRALMVKFRYEEGGSETTGHAVDIEEAPE